MIIKDDALLIIELLRAIRDNVDENGMIKLQNISDELERIGYFTN